MILLKLKSPYMADYKTICKSQFCPGCFSFLFREQKTVYVNRIGKQNHLSLFISLISKQPSSGLFTTSSQHIRIPADLRSVPLVQYPAQHPWCRSIMGMCDHLAHACLFCQAKGKDIGCGKHIYMHHVISALCKDFLHGFYIAEIIFFYIWHQKNLSTQR